MGAKVEKHLQLLPECGPAVEFDQWLRRQDCFLFFYFICGPRLVGSGLFFFVIPVYILFVGLAGILLLAQLEIFDQPVFFEIFAEF